MPHRQNLHPNQFPQHAYLIRVGNLITAVTAVLIPGLLIALTGCTGSTPSELPDPDQQTSRPTTKQPLSQEEVVVEKIVNSEELLLVLHDRLKAIAKSTKNLKLPDALGSKLFDETVQFTPLAKTDEATTARKVARKDLNIWPDLLKGLTRFEHSKFYMIRAHFDDADPDTFHSDIGFSGLAKTESEQWRAIKGTCQLVWKRKGKGDELWQISDWKTTDLHYDDASSLMFSLETDQLITDSELRKKLKTSQHMEYAKTIFETGDLQLKYPNLKPYFRIQQAGQHPGISVVDYDNDGWDDLYICDEWRRNVMLKNVQGKKMVNVAAKIGLDIPGPATSAIFADFDNDGDQDLMLGCMFQPCKLFINEKGKFVDRTTTNVDAEMPKLTTSISAADYNGDGLVDVYISTYGFPAGRRSSRSKYWLRDFLTQNEQTAMKNSPASERHRILNALGPPNLLLVNTGKGTFATAPENQQVRLHHNTFQASWSDYDLDGDPDLYISNDFAPDFLIRNEGGKGFVNVTRLAGGENMMGFGMGACWGDFDLDGDFDLYASNMFSKAGRRITKQIDGLDERFARMATGNRLFSNDRGRFTLQKKSDGITTQAGKAGWAWGGQMADFDNDGRPDIYVCSGFFTAPEKYASTVDL